MEIWINYLNLALISGMFAISINVLMGYAGQFSVANVALGGIAGYAAGYMAVHYEWAFFPSMALGIFAAVLIGGLLSLPTMRLSSDYVILLTLAFATVAIAALVAVPQFGGPDGLLGIPPITVGGELKFKPNQFLPLVLIPTAICFALCWRLVYSPFGRVLRGIREQPTAVRALGKDVFAYKVITFAFTSGIAGVAGVMLVYYNQLAAPDLFNFSALTIVVAAVVIGGMGNLWGSLLGAAILTFIQPVLEKVVNLPADKAALWRLVVYGVILLVVLRLRPAGLLSEKATLANWKRKRRRRAQEKASPSPADNGDGSHMPDAAPVAAAVPPDLAADDAPAVGTKRNGAPVLRARGLKKHFGGIRAVSGLDIDLPAGKVTALVGPNGAGKTTVFNLLTNEIKLDEGEVSLNDIDVTRRPAHKIARVGLARSFQDVRTFLRMTVIENVMLGVPGQSGESLLNIFVRPLAVRRDERDARRKAMECLEFVGLGDRADDDAGDLGYGDQKLLAVARVLATQSEVLLVDEPAAGIDRLGLAPVIMAISRLRDAGKTVCLVEHNLDVVAQLADHVLFMEEGRVTEEGTMEEIMAKEHLAAVYFGHHHG